MKQCSKSENVLIIDSDYEEADGFIKGVREVTGEEWQVALHENNKIYGWRRYVRFFDGCTSNGSVRQKVRREDGIVLAAVLWNCNCILSAYVSYEKRYKLVIMTFIYKEKRGLAGKLFIDS